VFDTVINYLDKFGPELLVIQFGFLVILSTLFMWLWFSNRKKYHNLKHAIPANVVKNYLDSIIQNSTSLKSSLFRGGGIEVNGVPSVMPVGNLTGGESMGISGAPSTALLEEVNQKKAYIASLESQLSAAQNANRELEAKLASLQSQLAAAETRIRELEALLAQQRESGGGDEVLKNELNLVIKERDEIRERLREFEIISDDLANLKRLQQENDQLKRSLAALQGGGAAPEVIEETPAPSSKTMSQADVTEMLDNLTSEEAPAQDTKELEDFLGSPEEESQPPVAEVEARPAEEEAAPPKNKPEKTPEDLLSEFEKMLG
jgi:hypothetical protein